MNRRTFLATNPAFLAFGVFVGLPVWTRINWWWWEMVYNWLLNAGVHDIVSGPVASISGFAAWFGGLMWAVFIVMGAFDAKQA